MKTLILVAFLASSLALMADNNLLKNGDFSSGINFWDGDCRTPDSGAVDFNTPAATSTGVVVRLRHLDWTKVTQDFDGNIGDYIATISYSVSPDLKFSDKAEDYQNITEKSELTRLKDLKSDPGQWVLIINDLGILRYTYWKIVPKIAAGIQTVNAHVKLDSDATEKKGFYLLFPPGEGTITLHSITLVPQT